MKGKSVEILEKTKRANPDIIQSEAFVEISQVLRRILSAKAKDTNTAKTDCLPPAPNHFVFSLSHSLFDIKLFSELALSAVIALKIMDFGKYFWHSLDSF